LIHENNGYICIFERSFWMQYEVSIEELQQKDQLGDQRNTIDASQYVTLTGYSIRKMRFHLTPVRMVIKTTNKQKNVAEGTGKKKLVGKNAK
jgi:hypothetical protein